MTLETIAEVLVEEACRGEEAQAGRNGIDETILIEISKGLVMTSAIAVGAVEDEDEEVVEGLTTGRTIVATSRALRQTTTRLPHREGLHQSLLLKMQCVPSFLN